MELNKKEKKAIDELKSKREYFEYYPEGCNWRLSFDEEEVHTIIDVIINLLEKQQKEIEEKTTIIMAGAEKVKRLESQVEELLNVLDNEKKINYIKPIDIKPQKYISEDTIREKIELYNIELEHIKNGEEFENERPMYYWGKVALEELLEEQY